MLDSQRKQLARARMQACYTCPYMVIVPAKNARWPLCRAQGERESVELNSTHLAGPADGCPHPGKSSPWASVVLEPADPEKDRSDRRLRQRRSIKALVMTALKDTGADPEKVSANLLPLVAAGRMEPEIRAEIVMELEGGGGGKAN